jgi:hypothetical protein
MQPHAHVSDVVGELGEGVAEAVRGDEAAVTAIDDEVIVLPRLTE